MTMCPKHRVELICPACIGERGGGSQSVAKKKSSRANLKLAWQAKRKYTRCPRYPSHRWSPVTGVCPCGEKRPDGVVARDEKRRKGEAQK